ncbi:hypothetical protein [Thalassotalea marina]|uniref:DUF2897 family protein n=1 Tax=Thalassotalea marina TaxID=1673741 RepID=A0A919BJW1_9GAMM|nr:hypothetical protein [Thalassotalea marina]GHF93562.1 hypothetical protein GCM10017161_22500 [Thalassotalea marina]
MDNWIIILVFVVFALVIIGNMSTVRRNAKTPMRKQSLNDLKETLPRSNKQPHKMDTVKKK